MTDKSQNDIEGLGEALALLGALGQSAGPTAWIGGLEDRFRGVRGDQVRGILDHERVGRETLDAALLIKRMSGQINVLVHAIGILNALPFILEDGEIVESLSLGAGNTGRLHDLETDRRVAEFKFITWRGADTIRQNSLFADLFNLANNPTNKAKVLYVVGKNLPLKFLENRRALDSVLKDGRLAARFRAANGEQFLTVREYYDTVRDDVQMVDLVGIVPGLTAA
jgi:hypothetical protein